MNGPYDPPVRAACARSGVRTDQRDFLAGQLVLETGRSRLAVSPLSYVRPAFLGGPQRRGRALLDPISAESQPRHSERSPRSEVRFSIARLLYDESLFSCFFVQSELRTRVAQVGARLAPPATGSFRLLSFVFGDFLFRIGIRVARSEHGRGAAGCLFLFARFPEFIARHTQRPFDGIYFHQQ